MGTHPIFESDFDCLTDVGFSNMLKLALIGAAAAAPVLTFDRPSVTKKDINFMPFKQEIARPFGKDIVEDYQSEDGNYKYHAEIHYATDDNKDGISLEESNFQFSSVDMKEVDELFKNDMNAVDNLFADMMKMPTIFGSNMLGRIFSTEPKELEEEGSGSSPLFFF